jgi:hypothetical protein
MAVPGVIRFRHWQFGKQTTFGTVVAATRWVPYAGVLVSNPNWTPDTTDVGSIDPAISDYRLGIDVSAQQTGMTAYDELPLFYSALFKSGVTAVGGGAAKTWTYQVASLSQDPFELFTGEFGDDVTTPTNGWAQAKDGVLTSLALTGSEAGGPFALTAGWTFSDVNGLGNHALVGTVPTAGLSVDTLPERVMVTDTELYIDDTPGAIGTTKISSALHYPIVNFTQTVDKKRFANGSNTRFAVADYSRGPRTAVVDLFFAKADAAVIEAQKVFSATPVLRYVELRTTSPTIIGAGVPYSNSIRMPLQMTLREEADMNNNAVLHLVGHAQYDSTLTYAIKAVVVNKRTTL